MTDIRNFGPNPIHYAGTWESPNTKVGVWAIERHKQKFHCFRNNIRFGPAYPTLGAAQQACEDSYHKRLSNYYEKKEMQ